MLCLLASRARLHLTEEKIINAFVEATSDKWNDSAYEVFSFSFSEPNTLSFWFLALTPILLSFVWLSFYSEKMNNFTLK